MEEKTEEKVEGMKHGACWYVARGGDGLKYWSECSKRSDQCQTAFARKVRDLTGGCGQVHTLDYQPVDGDPLPRTC